MTGIYGVTGTEKCIGLFGTCDNSTWRNSFIEEYEKLGIEYFNPDAGDNWHPGMIEDENRHLNNDIIILFPVLTESLGTGSLGEIGFSVLNVTRNVMNGKNQTLVVLIDRECHDVRKSVLLREESNRARKLVRSKMEVVRHPNIFLVETLEEMKEVSLQLWNIQEQREEVLKIVNGE